jgi:hypothetical protein
MLAVTIVDKAGLLDLIVAFRQTLNHGFFIGELICKTLDMSMMHSGLYQYAKITRAAFVCHEDV